MKIYTCYDHDSRKQFERLKRRSSGKWQFLASGEWSQSPYHQGKHSFHFRCDASRQYWAVLSVGFPSRIIAVAHTVEPQEVETVAAEMLRAARDADGDCIDLLDSTGKIDRDKFWRSYRGKKNTAPPPQGLPT